MYVYQKEMEKRGVCWFRFLSFSVSLSLSLSSNDDDDQHHHHHHHHNHELPWKECDSGRRRPFSPFSSLSPLTLSFSSSASLSLSFLPINSSIVCIVVCDKSSALLVHLLSLEFFLPLPHVVFVYIYYTFSYSWILILFPSEVFFSLFVIFLVSFTHIPRNLIPSLDLVFVSHPASSSG